MARKYYKNGTFILYNINEYYREIATKILRSEYDIKFDLTDCIKQEHLENFLSLLYSDYIKVILYRLSVLQSKPNIDIDLIEFRQLQGISFDNYKYFDSFQKLEEYIELNPEFFEELLKSSVGIKNSFPHDKSMILDQKTLPWLQNINLIEDRIYSMPLNLEYFLEYEKDLHNEIDEFSKEFYTKNFLDFFITKNEDEEDFSLFEFLSSAFKSTDLCLNPTNVFVENLIILKKYNKDEFNIAFKNILFDSLAFIKYNLTKFYENYDDISYDYGNEIVIWNKFISSTYDDFIDFIFQYDDLLIEFIVQKWIAYNSNEFKNKIGDDLDDEIVVKIR
ncbi:MAG: hypothetical protein R3Y13_05610 [bacterium]